MANADLRDQRVYRACLNTAFATLVAELCGGDVIFTVRVEQRKRGEVINDQVSCLGPGKPLQELLQD